MVDKAKKLLLSLSILVLFALYSVRAHQHPSSSPPAVAQATAPAVAFSTEPTVLPTPTRASSSTTGLAARATLPVQPTDPVFAFPAIPRPTATVPATVALSPTATVAAGAYRDGTYTGSIADANWGNVEVQAVISNGRIRTVTFLDYPNHRNRSQRINEEAMPELIQEAITAQGANVDIVTGATDTSEAFIESLTAALHQASA